MSSVICTLPWPPSINHAWRSVGKRVIISQPYRKYKKAVADQVYVQKIRRYWTIQPLAVAILCRPPNARDYDIDNRAKCILDSLQACGVIVDDRAVDQLIIMRGVMAKPAGNVWVRIEEIERMDPAISLEGWFSNAAARRVYAGEQMYLTI